MEAFYYVLFSVLAVLVGGLLLTQRHEGSIVPAAGVRIWPACPPSFIVDAMISHRE